MKKLLGRLSLIGTAVSVYMGMNKMFVYDYNSMFPALSKNAYVGGDAYNYVINANYATAYFVLGLLFAYVGFNLLDSKKDVVIK